MVNEPTGWKVPARIKNEPEKTKGLEPTRPATQALRSPYREVVNAKEQNRPNPIV